MNKTPYCPEWEKLTTDENFRITRIVNRYRKKFPEEDQQGCEMDIGCVHLNEPLKLVELLNADDFQFFHDVCGIQKHLNRETGELENFFLPRFTQ